jgi:hypothetical protein
MSSSITQIISFASKTAANFEELANAGDAGTKGLQSQFLGSSFEEPEARLWCLGKIIARLYHPTDADYLSRMGCSDEIWNI